MVGRLAVALALAAGTATGFEGVPPGFWFVPGTVLEEGYYAVELGVDAGFGSSFSGPEGRRALKARQSVIAPITGRYGVLTGFEGWVVVPFCRTESPQSYRNAPADAPSEELTGSVAGADFGDITMGMKWRVWEGDDGRGGLLVHGGIGIWTGTDPWQMSQYNWLFRQPPRAASGDGAFKVLGGLEGYGETETFGWDVLAGYVWKMPIEATGMSPALSMITVNLPSPIIARVAAHWRADASWSFGGIADAFWAPAGRIVDAGLLADEPGATRRLLDSYENLVLSSGAVWIGPSIRGTPASGVAVMLGAMAPVAASRVWRTWRVDLGVSYTAKP